MPASLRQRPVAVLAAVVTALCVASIGGTPASAGAVPAATTATAATTSVAATTTVTSSTPVSTVLSPKVTPTSTPEVPNPLRGQYRWMGYESQPSDWPAPDVYYRDQVYWGRLERTKGVYDFSYIENGLKAAGAVGGKFGFRVISYCPGCWQELREDRASFPPIMPTYLPAQPGTGTWYDPDGSGPKTGWTISTAPDWNNEQFLSSWERLMAELGKRYGDDPRLGYIDVGGYGKYGEWWVDGAALHITDANGLRMIKAVASAFPKKHVLINTMSPVAFTVSALNANPNLGIRTDSVGCPNMYSMVTDPVDTRLRDVWKTRPFFAEWGTTGDPVVGRDQVKQWHVSTLSSRNMRLTYDAMTATQKAAYREAITYAGYRYAVTRAAMTDVAPGQQFRLDLSVNNIGSAPTYDPWTMRLVLRDSSGNRVATLPLATDLRKVLPGTTTSTSYLTAPAVPVGFYQASIETVDPSGYSKPMALANASRAADGSYPLGEVGIGVERPSSWPRDVTRDQAADVLAVEAKTGTLRVYPTTGSGGWRTPLKLGTGWNSYSKLLTAGTWDADAVSDLLLQTKAGDLYLRRGNGDGTFASAVRIGSGWSIHNAVMPMGDFDGDGKADLIARRASNGALYLYRGDGKGGFLSSTVVGSGWSGFTAVFSPGDFDGDGAVDLMARTSGGTLYLYRGDGHGSWKGRLTVGSGWQIFNAVTAVGDFNGDGAADVIARTKDGTLYLYPGTGTGRWKTRAKIGTGWQIFSTILR